MRGDVGALTTGSLLESRGNESVLERGFFAPDERPFRSNVMTLGLSTQKNMRKLQLLM